MKGRSVVRAGEGGKEGYNRCARNVKGRSIVRRKRMRVRIGVRNVKGRSVERRLEGEEES